MPSAPPVNHRVPAPLGLSSELILLCMHTKPCIMLSPADVVDVSVSSSVVLLCTLIVV